MQAFSLHFALSTIDVEQSEMYLMGKYAQVAISRGVINARVW